MGIVVGWKMKIKTKRCIIKINVSRLFISSRHFGATKDSKKARALALEESQSGKKEGKWVTSLNEGGNVERNKTGGDIFFCFVNYI